MFDHFCTNTELRKRYFEKGIKKLLNWQDECLQLLKDSDQSLIFSAPTSAGKTMVAEMVIQKVVLKRKEKALFIVPMIATGEEKLTDFNNLFSRLGSRERIKVEGYLGPRYSNSTLRKANIAVCTIEKANQLINRLIKEDRLHEIGVVVVDELHMLGDENRGYILELLLTKILVYNASTYSNEEESLEAKYPIQILGMSATCPNANIMAEWLGAKYYTTTERPVKLKECLVYEYDRSMINIGTFFENNQLF